MRGVKPPSAAVTGLLLRLFACATAVGAAALIYKSLLTPDGPAIAAISAAVGAVGVYLFGVLWLVRPIERRKRRREQGLCERCGFDLRASANCCSECSIPTKRSRESGPFSI
jgi:hypothetical protein